MGEISNASAPDSTIPPRTKRTDVDGLHLIHLIDFRENISILGFTTILLCRTKFRCCFSSGFESSAVSFYYGTLFADTTQIWIPTVDQIMFKVVLWSVLINVGLTAQSGPQCGS